MSETLARQLYHSLHGKLLSLPDDVIIYPAHGEGSPCGGNIGDRRSTTVGWERRNNGRLQILNEVQFVSSLLDAMPPAPTYYSRMKRINVQGAPILRTMPDPPLLSPKEFHKGMQSSLVQIVDTRSILGFGGGHMEGAISIELREEFPIWAGWMLDPLRHTLLVLRDRSHLDPAVRHLIRIGCDHFAGYLRDMRSYQESGLPLIPLRPMFVQELKSALERGDDLQILDVRRKDEYNRGHIKGAKHIFVPEIRCRADELDKDRPIVAYCGSGFRSSIAASLLQQMGFNDVRNVPGSMKAWLGAGFEVVRPDPITNP